MHVFGDRPASGLVEILNLVKPKVSHWRLVGFYGTSLESSGLNVLALEEQVRDAGELGVVLDNSELWTLIAGLDQVWDCDLYGFRGSPTSVSLEDAIILLRAWDSSTWEVEVGETWSNQDAVT